MSENREKDYKFDDLCEIKMSLIAALRAEVAKGVEGIDTKEAGEVVDMIKDLAETERNCREAMYYETVIGAMEEGSEPRYGYRPNIKFENDLHKIPLVNPMYKPYVDQEPYIHAYMNDGNFDETMSRMGYSTPHMPRTGNEGRYGRAYGEYRQSRRNYTASNSAMDKEEMNEHAMEHVNDTLVTLRDIWKNADPELRKRMKADLSALVSEMTV